MTPAVCCKSLVRSLSPELAVSIPVESGWFLLIERRRRISRTSARVLNHFPLDPLSLCRSSSPPSHFLSSLPGAPCAATCAAIRHHSNPTCGSTPGTRTTTTSKSTRPSTRPSPRVAGKHCSLFRLEKVCECGQPELFHILQKTYSIFYLDFMGHQCKRRCTPWTDSYRLSMHL